MSEPTTPTPSAAEPTAPAAPAPDIELPACFYLGDEFDLATKTVLNKPVMYDARDLTTHGVVVGMTGSGKTGLCISLLEEAAIDSIPCIIIDPKGDLTNLLLQFPDLAPADFQKWLNPDDARLKGMSLENYAKQLADKWRTGLESSRQSAARIQRLKESAEWRIYTPGSEAGMPLSVLQTFQAPKGKVSREALNQKIDATTTALLGLTGISADPVQSREHILIAQLLLHSWSKQQDLDLPTLIGQIQVPPMNKIGAFEVDTFYPEKDRLKLAVALNNLLAAPSFSTWIQGEALDLSRMLYGKGEKPRHLIFYVAHLDDAQRMFFITLLLEEVLSWTRKQPGTTSLRAILYFDEVYGYLPPHPANPPTKVPLMTLLKQARAFGVGVLLATQNPVDLDYKALSNAGTWFIGKLQTDRDKARLIEGLEGVAAESGTLNSRAYLETVISALGNRIFLLHDIHKGKPLLFQSRHVLSFLRGPLTRDQIAVLMDPLKEAEAAEPRPPVADTADIPPVALPVATPAAPRTEDRQFKQTLQGQAAPVAPETTSTAAPSLPVDVQQFFLPLSSPAWPTGAALVYQLRLLGVAEVLFVDKKRGLSPKQTHRLLVEIPENGQVNWFTSERMTVNPAPGPLSPAQWTPVSDAVNTARKLKALAKVFSDYLYNSARLLLRENAKLELLSQPGEDAQAFQQRCRAAAAAKADVEMAQEKNRYAPKFAALGAKVPEGPVEQQSSLLNVVNPLAWVSFAFSSRPSAATKDKLEKLRAEWFARQQSIAEKWRQVGEEHTDIPLTPRRQDVLVTDFGLAWTPFWQVPGAGGRVELVAAYR